MKAAILCLSALLLIAETGHSAELVLGTVKIELGAPEERIIAALKTHFMVRAREGGWEVRAPNGSKESIPTVGIAAKGGRISRVSFLWGPGVTPSVEEMAKQLAHALPAKGTCEILNVTRPFEGGTVRTLVHRCDDVLIDVAIGVWPSGRNTASIVIRSGQ
jgi:hypothetical protein